MEIDNKILNLFKCFICTELMAEKIYICLNGHSVCEKCWEMMYRCPFCRMFLSRIRNFTLEEIFKKVQFLMEEPTVSLEECSVKLLEVKCPFNNCTVEKSVEEILPHVRNNHFYEIKKILSDGQMYFNICKSTPTEFNIIVNYARKIFVIYCQIDFKNSKGNIKIEVMDSNDNFTFTLGNNYNYMCKITSYGTEKSENKMFFNLTGRRVQNIWICIKKKDM